MCVIFLFVFIFYFFYFGTVRRWLILFARKLPVPLETLLIEVFFKCHF